MRFGVGGILFQKVLIDLGRFFEFLLKFINQRQVELGRFEIRLDLQGGQIMALRIGEALHLRIDPRQIVMARGGRESISIRVLKWGSACS